MNIIGGKWKVSLSAGGIEKPFVLFFLISTMCRLSLWVFFGDGGWGMLGACSCSETAGDRMNHFK